MGVINVTTGQRIKAARQQAGLTQIELAEKLEIPYQSIGQWERDTRKPKQETLLKIAKALGVHLRDLVDDSWLEEFDRKHPGAFEKVQKGVQELRARENYLKELGFTVSEQVTKWHWEDENETDPAEKVKIPDEVLTVLSKDGHTATFTDAEFEELQAEVKARAKEAIEGWFYKKVLEQQKK